MAYQPAHQAYGGVHHRAPPGGQYGGDPAGAYGQPPRGTPFFDGSQAPAFMNDPVATAALAYGSTMAATGKDYVEKNIERLIARGKLKYYFNVSNSYVLSKLKLLLFPFGHKGWARQVFSGQAGAEFAPPRDDINAPDLYIPVMAFATYVLVVGLSLGTQLTFSPEALGITASSALMWLCVEVLAMYFGFYLLNISAETHVFDLMAFCGYKFVGIIVAMLVRLVTHSNTAYFAALAWTSLSVSYFLIKSLRLVILPEGGSGHGARGQWKTYFLLFVAASQVLLSYIFSRV